MGVFIKKIVYDDKSYFAGYSTITNRYFTPPYSEIAPLIAMKNGDSPLFTGYKTKSDVTEDIVNLSSTEISSFLSLPSSSPKIAQFVLEAVGFYDEGPKIANLEPIIEASFDNITQSIEDLVSNHPLSPDQIQSFNSTMNLLAQKNGFTPDSPSPIDLLNRLYSK